MASFTREQLNEMTVPELREMCVYDLAIPGMTKKRKDVIIDAILAKHGAAPATVEVSKKAPEVKEELKGIAFSGSSVITKPTAKFGDRATTTVQISCGANSGAFPVAGKSVNEVGDFLREIFNVDRLSTGLVNGKEVEGTYTLKPGDTLEFLKPAGSKGC